VATARVLDKPDPVDGTQLARTFYRDRLERLDRGESEYTKVRYKTSDGKTGEGFVGTRNLATKEPPESTDEGNAALNWMASGAEPKVSSPASAGARGLTQIGRDYTKANNYEAGRVVVEGQMDKMTLETAALEKFLREGRLGDYAGGGRK
jgi:hypothetical protein